MIFLIHPLASDVLMSCWIHIFRSPVNTMAVPGIAFSSSMWSRSCMSCLVAYSPGGSASLCPRFAISPKIDRLQFSYNSETNNWGEADENNSRLWTHRSLKGNPPLRYLPTIVGCTWVGQRCQRQRQRARGQERRANDARAVRGTGTGKVLTKHPLVRALFWRGALV